MKNKEMVKSPQIAPLSGYTTNVLLDLGNCYKLTCGHNRLTRRDICVYLGLAIINIQQFAKSSRDVYERDLKVLSMAIGSFEQDSVMFGELCRAFYKLKANTVWKPRQEEKFLSSITKRLGEDATDNIEEENKKWKVLTNTNTNSLQP